MEQRSGHYRRSGYYWAVLVAKKDGWRSAPYVVEFELGLGELGSFWYSGSDVISDTWAVDVISDCLEPPVDPRKVV